MAPQVYGTTYRMKYVKSGASAMDAAVTGVNVAEVGRPRPSAGEKAVVAVVCVAGGYLPVAAGYVPGDVARLVYGLCVTVALLALALLARRSSTLRRYWEIPLAFFGLALFVLADRYVPDLLRTRVLHVTTTSGNPIASTVFGTVIVQLDELVL